MRYTPPHTHNEGEVSITTLHTLRRWSQHHRPSHIKTMKSASPPSSDRGISHHSQYQFQDGEVSITALQTSRSGNLLTPRPSWPITHTITSKTTSLIFPNHNISYHNILKFSIPSIMNFIKTNIHISHSHTHIYKHNTQIVPIVRLYSPRAQKQYTKA